MAVETVPMSASGKVNIRPGVSVLSVLRHLKYSPWFALAEFVDNSVQSYFENKSKLHELHGPAWTLKVSIDIDTSWSGRIIRDNAAGIGDAFPRAFRPAVIPPDGTGLSEFGGDKERCLLVCSQTGAHKSVGRSRRANSPFRYRHHRARRTRRTRHRRETCGSE